jgi:hypothetical protein
VPTLFGTLSAAFGHLFTLPEGSTWTNGPSKEEEYKEKRIFNDQSRNVVENIRNTDKMYTYLTAF